MKDILQRGRDASAAFADDATRQGTADLVRDLCDEIERLRKPPVVTVDTHAVPVFRMADIPQGRPLTPDPSVAERLTRYREALAANSRLAEMSRGAVWREDEAHAMLRAEREPDR